MRIRTASRLTSMVFAIIIISVILSTTCFATEVKATSEVSIASVINVTTTDYLETFIYCGSPATISLGSSGEKVRYLQNLLNNCINSYLNVNGVFGTETQNAVKKLQNYAGTRTINNQSFKFTAIYADGVVGQYTWGKLEYMAGILSN